MTERCTDCGAALFRGQQFCRKCGAPTMQLGGEAPTQILPHGTPEGEVSEAATSATTPLRRGTADATRPPRPTERQTAFGHASYTSPMGQMEAAGQHTAAAKKRRWVIPALLGMLLLVVVGGGAIAVMMSRGALARKMVFVEGGMPHPPGVPAVPLPAAGADGVIIDDEGAIVSGDMTVITKTLPLDPEGTLSIRNFSGNIRVEGWDEERAELKIIKRGGSADDRRNARVTLAHDDEHLSLAAPGAGGPVEVAFEVRVPRGLQKVEISSASSEVRVSKLEAPLVVNVKTGSIKLEDVRGEARTGIFNGDTEVIYGGDGAGRGSQQEFSSVNGDIDVTFAAETNADLTAEVVQGDIEVDDSLGLRVQKRMVGRKVEGRVGEGGETLSIKSVNGSIKIKKQSN